VKYVRYLRYLAKHKWFVLIACCKLGIPWLGLLHDLSKFRLDEFLPYADYFYGTEKGEHAAAAAKAAFDAAWLRHIHRNKHHPQHWFLRGSDTDGDEYLTPHYRYIAEMVADWLGAGMAQKGHGMAQAPAECRAWWEANKDRSGYRMSRRTRNTVEALLSELVATAHEN